MPIGQHGNHNIKTKECPLVSLIIPCRNEAKFIARCLDSVLAQDHPKDRLEVIVVDGVSTDGTRDILKQYVEKYSIIKVIDNPELVTPVALNRGIKNATGKVIMIMSAHASYPKNYVSVICEWLMKGVAENVGCLWNILPGDDTSVARAIAKVLSTPLGAGNALYKTGVSQPVYTDTVPFGAYPREVFERVGMFNEKLLRYEDYEFNHRLRKQGGRILLIPDVSIDYYARSTLRALAVRSFGDGFWNIYSLKFSKVRPALRHLLPLVFICFVIFVPLLAVYIPVLWFVYSGVALLYLFLVIGFSLKIALQGGISLFVPAVGAYLILHLSHGFGSLVAVMRMAGEALAGLLFFRKQGEHEDGKWQ